MLRVLRARRPLLASAFAVAALAAAAAGQPRREGTQRSPSEVSTVRRYARGVNVYVAGHAQDARVFANDADEEGRGGGWAELKGRDERQTASQAYESVAVWSRGGRVILARFIFQTPSGDWAHFVDYYFREDGTLAKVEAQLNTFYGRVSVFRDRAYGRRGELLRAAEGFYRLGTKRRVRPDENFIDEPIPFYKTAQDLPFHSLLK